MINPADPPPRGSLESRVETPEDGWYSTEDVVKSSYPVYLESEALDHPMTTKKDWLTTGKGQ